MRVRLKLIFGCILGILALNSYANITSTPFSQYGVIQNVQNYSSNPFWSPNGSYNQRMPTPVYATGTDVETADCQRVVSALVTAQCAVRDNCKSTQLSDIRPAIILTLSRMPNANYATACAGFIDGAFQDYMRQTGYAVPTVGTPFPTPTAPNPNKITPNQNWSAPPMAPSGIPTPEWFQGIMEREQELQELQAQNSANSAEIYRADFPTTYADLSLEDRLANEAVGYAPFKDKSAYTTIELEDIETYTKRIKDKCFTEHGTGEECCQKYPNDEKCKEYFADKEKKRKEEQDAKTKEKCFKDHGAGKECCEKYPNDERCKEYNKKKAEQEKKAEQDKQAKQEQDNCFNTHGAEKCCEQYPKDERCKEYNQKKDKEKQQKCFDESSNNKTKRDKCCEQYPNDVHCGNHYNDEGILVDKYEKPVRDDYGNLQYKGERKLN